MHTSEPGSPFSAIYSDISKVTSKDITECAVFTACFSKAWKSEKAQAQVDIFKSSQIHKSKNMKIGTWGVYGKVQRIKVPLKLTITRQEGVLRAVPDLENRNFPRIRIIPGDIDKNDMLAKLEIELNEPLSKDEVLQALPSGGFKVISSKKFK